MTNDSELYDPASYRNVRKPLLEAETLPAWCYTSHAFHDREVERIFAKCWTFVGCADEVAKPGDYLTFDTTGGPVVVLRGQDNEVRAFANVCRHRGTKLLSGAGHCKRIVCPYHSWVYGLDGALRQAPGMRDAVDFRQSDYSLLPIRLELWDGFIFINLDAWAEPLHEYLGDMPERFAAYKFQDMVCVRRTQYEVACNWKLLIENALEAYHTGTVHRATLGQQISRPETTLGNWDALFVEGEDSIAVLPDRAASFAPIPGLTGKQVRGTYFTVIYPCTQFACAQDCMWWLAVHPQGPARCKLVLGSCFPKSTAERTDFDSAVQPYFERWDSATPEDNAISEAQQIGQQFAARRPGRFSAHEFVVHNLANWVLDRVLDE